MLKDLKEMQSAFKHLEMTGGPKFFKKDNDILQHPIVVKLIAENQKEMQRVHNQYKRQLADRDQKLKQLMNDLRSLED